MLIVFSGWLAALQIASRPLSAAKSDSVEIPATPSSACVDSTTHVVDTVPALSPPLPPLPADAAPAVPHVVRFASEEEQEQQAREQAATGEGDYEEALPVDELEAELAFFAEVAARPPVCPPPYYQPCHALLYWH